MSSFEQSVKTERLPIRAEHAPKIELSPLERSQKDILFTCHQLLEEGVTEEMRNEVGISKTLWDGLLTLASEPLDERGQELWPAIVESVSPKLEALFKKLLRWEDIKVCDVMMNEVLLKKPFSAQERAEILSTLDVLNRSDIQSYRFITGVESTNAPLEVTMSQHLDGKERKAVLKKRSSEAAHKLMKGKDIPRSDTEDDETYHKRQQDKDTYIVRRCFDEKKREWTFEKHPEYDLGAFDAETAMRWDRMSEGERQQREAAREEFAHDVLTLKIRLERFAAEHFRAAVRKHLGERLGVEPETIKYDPKYFNAREGVELGQSTIGEWMNSRMSLALGFRTVPVVVLRMMGGKDVASLQEAITNADGNLAKNVSMSQATAMLRYSPRSWKEILSGERPREDRANDKKPLTDEELKSEPIRSMVRAAITSYLGGGLDDASRNMVINPATTEVFQVDKGLSFGLLNGERFTYPRGQQSSGKEVPIYADEFIRSSALELVLFHGLKMDKETHEMVRGLYKTLSFPLEVDSDGKVLRKQKTAEQTMFIAMFRARFGSYGEKMVVYQFNQFLSRLKNVVDHGYPKELTKNLDYLGEIEHTIIERARKIQAQRESEQTVAA